MSDVETKMKARKELDRILGLNQMPDLGSLQMGDITINIVDASKREEIEDSRNTVVLEPNQYEEVVTQEKDEPKSKSDEFFDNVGE